MFKFLRRKKPSLEKLMKRKGKVPDGVPEDLQLYFDPERKVLNNEFHFQGKYHPSVHPSVLGDPLFGTYVELLHLDHLDFTSIDFLKNIKTPKDVDLSWCKGIQDFSPLAGMNLADYVEDLRLEYTNIRDLTVLEGYQKIKNLDVIGCEHLKDFNTLSRLVTLRYVEAMGSGIDDVSVFKDLPLTLLRVGDIRDMTLRNVSSLDSAILRNSLEHVTLGGYAEHTVEVFSSFQRLGHVELHGVGQSVSLEALGSDTLHRTLSYIIIQNMSIIDVPSISLFPGLTSLTMGDVRSDSWEYLRRGNKAVSTIFLNDCNCDDLSLLTNFPSLKDAYLSSLPTNNIESILGWESVQNGSLKKLDIKHLDVDWTNVANGRVIKTLNDCGIEVTMDQEFHYDGERIHKPQLQDYLSKTLGLQTRYVDTILKWYDGRFANGVEYASQIYVDGEVSFNKVFHAVTEDGKKLILKFHTNQFRADIEQAINYYLPREGFANIVDSDEAVPFEYGGMFVTVQRDVSDEGRMYVPLARRLAVEATLNADAQQALEKNGIFLPRYTFKDFAEMVEDMETYGGHEKGIPIQTIKDSKEEHVYAQDLLRHARWGLNTGDPKSQNWWMTAMNRVYALDFDLAYIGPTTLDVAHILNDPKLRLPEELHEGWGRFYFHFYSKRLGIDNTEEAFQAFREELIAGKLERGLGSIVYNLREFKRERTHAVQKLEYLGNFMRIRERLVI